MSTSSLHLQTASLCPSPPLPRQLPLRLGPSSRSAEQAAPFSCHRRWWVVSQASRFDALRAARHPRHAFEPRLTHFSSTSTLAPPATMRAAVASPPMPLPMMIASYTSAASASDPSTMPPPRPAADAAADAATPRRQGCGRSGGRCSAVTC
eukprot:230278-Chlamydomonas_euryale.AAC.5